MKAYYHSERTSSLNPYQAIILYRDSNRYDGDGPITIATLNPVVGVGNKLQIQPGSPITRADFDAVIASLAASENKLAKPADAKAPTAEAQLTAWLSPNIIALSAGCMAWVAESARRPIFFNAHGENDKPLAKLNGKAVTHPHLLFVAQPRGLRIFALRTERRPTLKTRLCHAPYFNVWDNGGLCRGSAPLPSHMHPSYIPAFERAFFDSNFTHTNRKPKDLTIHPGGHHKMWADLLKLKTFPPKWLRQTRYTVADVLKTNEKEN